MKNEVVISNKKLKNYLRQAKDGFVKDPPDTEFQRGYLAALEEISRMLAAKEL